MIALYVPYIVYKSDSNKAICNNIRLFSICPQGQKASGFLIEHPIGPYGIWLPLYKAHALQIKCDPSAGHCSHPPVGLGVKKSGTMKQVIQHTSVKLGLAATNYGRDMSFNQKIKQLARLMTMLDM